MTDRNPNCVYGNWDCMPCTNCAAYIPPMTNADRIRAMSDAKLAWAFMEFRIDAYAKTDGCESVLPCTQKAILEWLQQPAEVE